MSRVHYFMLIVDLIFFICSLSELLRIGIIIARYISDLFYFILLILPSILDLVRTVVLIDLGLINDVMQLAGLIVMILSD